MGEGKRSHKKRLAYVAAFVVFQTAIILVFALTVMKIKSPKVRFGAMADVENINFNNGTIIMKLLAQLAIKNTNFGHFKYDESTLIILHNGMPIGEAVIPRGRTKAKKTQKFEISVRVTISRVSIHIGILKLSSQAKLNGKVHLMKIIKKKRSAQMSCDWDLDFDEMEVYNLKCK